VTLDFIDARLSPAHVLTDYARGLFRQATRSCTVNCGKARLGSQYAWGTPEITVIELTRQALARADAFERVSDRALRAGLSREQAAYGFSWMAASQWTGAFQYFLARNQFGNLPDMDPDRDAPIRGASGSR